MWPINKRASTSGYKMRCHKCSKSLSCFLLSSLGVLSCPIKDLIIIKVYSDLFKIMLSARVAYFCPKNSLLDWTGSHITGIELGWTIFRPGHLFRIKTERGND